MRKIEFSVITLKSNPWDVLVDHCKEIEKLGFSEFIMYALFKKKQILIFRKIAEEVTLILRNNHTSLIYFMFFLLLFLLLEHHLRIG